MQDDLLIKAVSLLLDDSHGISDEAHAALMQYVFATNPASKALEILACTQSFKGRKFLPEEFNLEEELGNGCH